MNVDERLDRAERRVDAFVAAVNASGLEPMEEREVPLPCRASAPNGDGLWQWRIVAAEAGEWLVSLETRLPFRLPPTFRALVSRYCFPSFTRGPLWWYSVGLAEAARDSSELRVAMLRDRPMLRVLWKAGYLPFARPAEGSYDPVCFDFNSRSDGREPAVVRIDHEGVLVADRIQVVEILSPGLDRLIEELTA